MRRAFILLRLLLVILTVAATAAAVWLVAMTNDWPSLKAAGVNPPVEELPPGIGGQPPAASGPSSVVRHPSSLPTLRPWPTMQPTPTAAPPAPVLPAATPTLEPPQRVAVNGVAWESIVVMPPEVIARSREIAAAGRALGRDPHAFSKVGDSTIENPHFLARFDEGPYNLGDYAYLQPVIDQFRGSHGRDSLAARIGLHAWTANDPMWADASFCLPNETPVECEIRVHNPSVIFIRLGTNDTGAGAGFEANIRRIVDTAIAAGVVPIVGTKGDRHEGSNENNDILRRVAADYHIPLWDYDRVAATLPGRGLDQDFAHMTAYYSHDYTDPIAFTRGHAVHNLTALLMLDALWREVIGR